MQVKSEYRHLTCLHWKWAIFGKKEKQVFKTFQMGNPGTSGGPKGDLSCQGRDGVPSLARNLLPHTAIQEPTCHSQHLVQAK